MVKQSISHSPRETKRIAREFAKEVLKMKRKKEAITIALFGDLGSGKTTFLQGFAKGLGIRRKVLSPTFLIVKRFPFKGKNFYHIDCYRIKEGKELLELGFKKIISGSQNIVALEWAEKVKKILPKNIIKVSFEFLNRESRKIKIEIP